MTFKDYFSRQSSDYAQYRPRYPRELFGYLASLCETCDRAWDCATGNGQAALELARLFSQVVATDGSVTQISQAQSHANITYQVALADQSGLADHSVNLVTVAQAAHWFDLGDFYTEVQRVVKPGGIVALWCYELMTISEAMDPLIHYFYRTVVDPYWPPERALVENHYRTLPFPFSEIAAPSFQMQTTWTLEQLYGYLFTWSASQNYLEATGQNPLNEVSDRFLAAWGDFHEPKSIHWPIHLRVGAVSPPGT
ncbi:MAG: class I SAM-dependent methyltransferase [Elainellaceae cyanobacterium]